MSTQVSPTTTAPVADGPAPARRLLMLAPWLVAPVVVWLAYLALPGVSDLRSQYQAAAVALVSAPLLGWLLTRRSPVAHSSAAAVVAALLPALTLISLHGTDWFFSGPFGDQSFRLEYATRFADSLSLQDYTYRDVPAFYSPGWFWVVGLVCHVVDVPAWQAYKWVAIVSLYLAAALAYAAWRATSSTRLSALLLAVTVIGLPARNLGWLGEETLMFAGAYEPYAWLVALPLPAVLTWFGSARGPFSWRRGVLLGVALAAAAWLYVLYAVAAVVAVLIIVVWRWRDRPRVLELLVAGATSLVLVAPWLGRFLIDWLAAGSPPAVATSWIQDDSFVHLVNNAVTPWLGLALIGAVGLLAINGTEHRRLRGAQALAATVLLLGVVQVVVGQAGSGVLFHRLLLLFGLALLAAGVLTLRVVAPVVLARLRDIRPGLPLRRIAAAVLSVLLFINLGAHAREWVNMSVDLRKLAHDVPYPDGTFPTLSSPSTREQLADQVPVTELADAIRSTARSAGQDETGVVLTDNIAMLAVEPLHSYLQWWSLYSNPLGEYEKRRDYLEALAKRPAADIVRRLRDDPDAPTVFALRVDDDGTATFGSAGWDPLGGPRGGGWSVELPESLFDGDDFVTTRVGDWLVAALKPS
jgi:galactan 5-O-arabinofuranosyltransferase